MMGRQTIFLLVYERALLFSRGGIVRGRSCDRKGARKEK